MHTHFLCLLSAYQNFEVKEIEASTLESSQNTHPSSDNFDSTFTMQIARSTPSHIGGQEHVSDCFHNHTN